MTLRLMIYDRTCRGPGPVPGLTTTWWLGGHLYRALGRLDGWAGFSRWADALDWLIHRGAEQPIQQIQYWGHGNFGCAKLAGERLDEEALDPGHPLHPRLQALRDRLLPGGRALFWFRTCETFGGPEGHAFARAWTRFFRCRAAGHTFVIGPLQSGLHELGPDEEPHWPLEEGRSPDPSRRRALWSGLRAPSTVSFLTGRVPPVARSRRG